MPHPLAERAKVTVPSELTDGAYWNAPGLGILVFTPSAMLYRITLHLVAGRASGPDGVVAVDLTGFQEVVPAPDLVELGGIAGREVVQDDLACPVPGETSEQEPLAGHARPVLPSARVHACGRRRAAPAAEVEELEVRLAALERLALELLVDEEVTVDPPVGAVGARSVDLEGVPARDRTREDVVLTGMLPRVLLPCEEVLAPDALVLTELASAEEELGGSGGPRRGQDRQNEAEDSHERRRSHGR